MNRRKLEDDPIFLYMIDKFERIGVRPPILSVCYQEEDQNARIINRQKPVHNDLINNYLTMYEGQALFDLYKILIYLEDDLLPENVGEEIEIQLNKYFDPVDILEQMITHIKIEKMDQFPVEFEELFGLVYKFGYRTKPKYSLQLSQIQEMLAQI